MSSSADPSGTAGPSAGRAVFLSFFLSASTLALEVSLTRIFSVVLWYHFGFMIVALAMIGFALAGAILRNRASMRIITLGDAGRAALTAGGLILPAIVALTRVPVDPMALLVSLPDLLLFGLVIVLTGAPFCFLGYAFCAVLEAGRRAVGRVYGASFLGGACGVGLALAGMEFLGGGSGVIAAAAAAWVAGLAVAGKHKIRAAAALLAMTVSLVFAPLVLPETSRKHFPNVPADQVIDREWNAFSSVLFYRNPLRHGLWAMPESYGGPLPEMLGVAIDEWAITSIIRFDGDLSGLRFLEAYPPTLGLETAKRGFDALVIGAGGGLDVLGALYFGAGHVTAVEINPTIVNAVKGRFADYSGGLYNMRSVRAVASEGRHFVERDEDRYDRIVLTGVDTFAATQAGAFALSENYIYTVEAFSAYLDRLDDGGMICMTRWFYEPPRQTLRLIAAAEAALTRAGVDDPAACLFLARAKLRSLILMKKEPFTRGEVEKLLAGCGDRDAAFVYAKGVEGGHPTIGRFLTKEGRAEMERGYAYRVDAPTDDRPFLFDHTLWKNLFAAENDWFMDRLGGQEVLFATFLALVAAAGGGLLVTGLFRRRKGGIAPSGGDAGKGRVLAACAFGLTGAAYLGAEIVLLPKLVLFLGHPVYAMSIVLVGLLICSGLGSIFSRRLPARPAAVLAACLAAAISLPFFFNTVAGLLSPTILHAGIAGKIACTTAIIALPGFLMGLPFPLAVRVFEARSATLVPRAFLWNGIGSALACPLATALAITIGFNASILVAALVYGLSGAAFAVFASLWKYSEIP